MAQLNTVDYITILNFLKEKRIGEYELFFGNSLGSTAYKVVPESEHILIFSTVHIINKVYDNYSGFIHAGIRVNALRTIIREVDIDFNNANALNIAGYIDESINRVLRSSR